MSGELRLVAHARQSYDVHVTLRAPPLTPGGPPQVGGWSPARGTMGAGFEGAAALGVAAVCQLLPCTWWAARLHARHHLVQHRLDRPVLQESKGKFDLKEPYYRQQMQWMMQMAAAAPTAGADGAAAAALGVDTPAVDAAAAAMGVPQHLMDTN